MSGIFDNAVGRIILAELLAGGKNPMTDGPFTSIVTVRVVRVWAKATSGRAINSDAARTLIFILRLSLNASGS